MKKLDALREVMKRPWYREEMYLSTWAEYSMTRHCILTPTDVIGWGSSWEAAIADADRRESSKAPQEPWGTLEGAERYLEHQDRMSFLDLRRAKQAGYHSLTLELLQDRWIAYGEAWGIIQRLLPKPEPIALH